MAHPAIANAIELFQHQTPQRRFYASEIGISGSQNWKFSSSDMRPQAMIAAQSPDSRIIGLNFKNPSKKISAALRQAAGRL